MKKLSFVEKNDALVKLKNKEHFDKDCELLRMLNPTSRLHNEIANASEFSISSLSGRILMELLDLAPIEKIESNRSVADVNDNNTPGPTEESKEESKLTNNASGKENPKASGKGSAKSDKKKATKSKKIIQE